MASYDSKLEEARLHIEEIRSEKFSIGKKLSNPLTIDLHHAVTSLSAELYTKDVHFIMELIQNAEDNEYEESVEATLEFVLTKEDITKSGASTTLLIFNNENGFSERNMESLCSVGRSTKKGKRTQGFIGEKGIGFKSVFLVSPEPHIFSNGYQVRFKEKPDPDCGIGYIVPEWVFESPLLSDVQRVYGSKKKLPTTTFVLPLKPEKVQAVKAQLLALHPEILLFLSKVKRLYVREDGCGSTKQDNVSVVSISSETNHVDLSSRGADLRVVQLSVKEKSLDGEETCKYFMWKQSFPVKPENVVSSRADVKQWIVTLAFPFGKRLSRGTSSVGVFAFLPTTMITGFPFVIQADFILASSRESILFDSPWNLGILECVPTAFVNAFRASVEDGSWFSSTSQVFEFLPAQASSYSELNKLRESIRKLLRELKVVPCELFNDSKFLAKPGEVIKILPKFREILVKFKDKGGCLRGLRTLNKVLHSSVDLERYSTVLDFLGVKNCNDWYAKCLKSCHLVTQASPEVYVDILYFFAEQARWNLSFCFRDSLLIRYINKEGNEGLCSVSQIRKGDFKVKYASKPDIHLWLIKCNMEFGCPNSIFFLPSDVQKYLIKHPQYKSLFFLLTSSLAVTSISVDCYAYELFTLIPKEGIEPIIQMSHFLYVCHKKKFVNNSQVYDLCAKIPIIDGSGHVVQGRSVTLVPASNSKWAELFGFRNPYSSQNYVDIGDGYAKESSFLGVSIPYNSVLNFICKYIGARDLPDLVPPNMELQITSSQLSKEQAFLLLNWIRLLQTKDSNVPEKFMGSIQNGKWMKTCNGYKSPRQSFFPDVAGNPLYDMAKHILEDFSVIDRDFYGDRINSYQDELRFLGVAIQSEDLEKLVSTRCASLATSAKLAPNALSILKCFKKMSQTLPLGRSELQWIFTEKWLKTRHGYKAPKESIIFSSRWAEISSFVDLPLVDDGFYGIVIYKYKDELQRLGVITDFKEGADFVLQGLKYPIEPDFVTPSGTIALLECIKYAITKSPDQSMPNNFLQNIAKSRFLKTDRGYLVPQECVLFDFAWKRILKRTDLPSVDLIYYETDIYSYKEQLRAIGVKVEPVEVCSLIFHFLFAQSDTSVIQRLYKFLSKFGWCPDKLDEHNSKVWIPDQVVGDQGKWVSSELCILHDKGNLFEFRLYSLSKYYTPNMLPLFSSAFGVRESPSMDEYLQLWNDWGLRFDCQISSKECDILWEAILKNRAPETEEAMKQGLIKVPAAKCSGDCIHLVNKDLVFIPDELRLKKIFSSVSVPLFVWFPEPGSLSSSVSLRKLVDLYCWLGVKKLSDSIICKVPSDMPKRLIQRNGLINKGLIKIILAFLSGPLVDMPSKDRHEKAKSLLELEVYESDQPIKVTYCLTNGSLEVETKKMVFWEKNSENLVIDGLGYLDRKDNIEFASCFAEEIAEGLLPKVIVPAVSGLSKFIHLGFMYEFNNEAVDFLLERENLELSAADEKFLTDAFPISSQPSVSLGKRQSNKTTQLAPSTPAATSKKQRISDH